MFKVSRYTADPTTAESELLVSAEYPVKELAENIAKFGSRVDTDDYYAVYASDGEQLSGFVNGKQVY